MSTELNAQNNPSQFSDLSDDSGFENQAKPHARLSSMETTSSMSRSAAPLLDMGQYGITDIFGENTSPNYSGLSRTLQDIPPRPGFVQRWVLFEVNGKPDRNNVARKRALGWIPRRADTIKGNHAIPKMSVQGGEVFMTNGYVLCEMPIEQANKIRASRNSETMKQNIAVRSELEEAGRADKTSVLYENTERVQVGMRPRTVEIPDNENQ